MAERFTFFWGQRVTAPHAESSQFFQRAMLFEGHRFLCCEQWMHWRKAYSDIEGFYKAVLGRDVDSAGLAAAQLALAYGAPLTSIESGIASSPEAANDINTIYLNVLGRPVDPTVLGQTQANEADGQTSLQNCQAYLAYSNEAASDIGILYQTILGRPVDANGLVGTQGYLATPGASFQAELSSVAYSSESANDITTDYQSIVGSSPSNDTIVAQQSILASGSTEESIQSNISAEYIDVTPGSLGSQLLDFSI